MIFSKFLICAYNSFQFGCLRHAGRVHTCALRVFFSMFFICLQFGIHSLSLSACDVWKLV